MGHLRVGHLREPQALAVGHLRVGHLREPQALAVGHLRVGHLREPQAPAVGHLRVGHLREPQALAVGHLRVGHLREPQALAVGHLREPQALAVGLRLRLATTAKARAVSDTTSLMSASNEKPTPSLASTVDGLEPEGAYRVLARAQALELEGMDVIHLEIGEPDFGTRQGICDAGIEAIQAGRTRYNPTSGIMPLRAAIADEVGRRCGISVRAENVVVGPGAKPHLFFPTLAVVEAGDEVVYPDPGFPTYEAMIRIAGGTPVPIPLSPANGFSLDLEALRHRVSDRTRMIVINSPGNPTGGVIPMSDLQEVARIANEQNCWVLSDEIYSRMCYDGQTAPSILSLDGMQERTILVDGFSKTYAMTGWRLGFGVMPQPLAEKVALLLVHAVGCTAHFTQYAGLEALRGSQDEVDEMMAAYQHRRDVLVAGLNSIPGIECQTPMGAFYVFPDISAFGRRSAEVAESLLEEAGVALLPGTAFGKHGEGFLRLCYANSVPNIEQAIERMRDWFGSLS